MIRFKMPVGVTALVVALVSILAPSQNDAATAQIGPVGPIAIPHTQPAAEEIVPVFVPREVVQDVPAATEPLVQAAVAKPTSLSALIATMPTSDPLDQQLECLAGAVYFEARGEPIAGQLAVAKVVINRAASGRFPASYCGVVLQRSQFSFVKRGRMPTTRTDSSTYRTARAIAQIAHRDLYDSAAEEALYFHARHVSPGWSGRRQAAARIHNHIFYN